MAIIPSMAKFPENCELPHPSPASWVEFLLRVSDPVLQEMDCGELQFPWLPEGRRWSFIGSEGRSKLPRCRDSGIYCGRTEPWRSKRGSICVMNLFQACLRKDSSWNGYLRSAVPWQHSSTSTVSQSLYVFSVDQNGFLKTRTKLLLQPE